jgi:flavodoxin I
MKKTILLYWAPGGNVEKAARQIQAQIGADKLEMLDVASFNVSRMDAYENFIFGIATIGAEIWRDAKGDNKWNEFFVKTENKDFSNKTFAFYGLGDQVLYPDHFVDALGYLKEEVEKRNGKIVGFWPTEGYTFTDSEGAADGKFFGLALDEDQEDELTPERIKNWTAQISKEMKL